MEKVTFSEAEMLAMGERVKECREMRGLTQDELTERIELLPENKGKTRNTKQLSYIERGKRVLSNEYAVLISAVLDVRIEYLFLKDNFKTEDERLDYRIHKKNTEYDIGMDLVTRLIENAGYRVENIDIPCLEKNGIIKPYPPNIDLKKIFAFEQKNGLIPPGTDYDEFISRTKGIRFIYKPSIEMKSPKGSIGYFRDVKEYMDMVQDITDFIDYKCATQFKKLIDGVEHLYDWG